MPPFASIEIPVISQSRLGGERPVNKGKAPVRQAFKPRTYDDGPLPVKPSDYAPKNAHIVGRSADESGVTYQLKIGDVEINDVDVDEILDYVSALDLEQYENRQFEEEEVVLKALEVEQERLKREKLDRIKERAKRKGVVLFEDDTATNEETEGGEDVLTQRGRARPTYAHLFKNSAVRKKNTEEVTSEDLLPLDSDKDDMESNEDESGAASSTARPKPPFTELPKRRRRKRDKVTGELLPLAPVVQSVALDKKRQRRRRHPLTNQLMPVGWQYDLEKEDAYDRSRAGQSTPSCRKFSMSQEQEAKRQKLDTGSSMSRSPSPFPTKAEIFAQLTPNKQSLTKSAERSGLNKRHAIDLVSSDDEATRIVANVGSGNRLKMPPRPARPDLSGNAFIKPTNLSSATVLSSEPEPKTSIISPSASKAIGPLSSTSHRAQQARTSIVNPSAGRASSTDPLTKASEDEESSEDDVDDGEWFIEDIVGHHLSDPRTHPPALGQKPVMLYHVRWQGYKNPTWEPVESFTHSSIVKEYHQRVGSRFESDDEALAKDDQEVTLTPNTFGEQQIQGSSSANVNPKQVDEPGDDLDLDEDEFEVEAIVAHQLSDPRTHPKEFGKAPVILYQVKWKDYEQTTWEPATSFEDESVVKEYERRMELTEPSPSSDSDLEMLSVD